MRAPLPRAVVLLLLLIACGATARERTLRTSVATVIAARGGFYTWDRQHQSEIVQKATTREQAIADLAAYREKAARIDQAFEATYMAIAVAATSQDELTLGRAIKAVADVIEAVEQLTGTGGP